MDWKLQMIVIGVTDVDRAKAFYAEKLGFAVDVDHTAGEHFRVVQVTPPGSACSLTFGVNVGAPAPGAVQGLHLVVEDIEAAAAQLDAAGVDHSGGQHFESGQLAPGFDPRRNDYGSYVFFTDPDGNGWAVQEVGHSRMT